jgi:hypothetical protein
MPQAIIIPAPTCTDPIVEMMDLAVEIMETEGRDLTEALIIAGADMGIVAAYGERWDNLAFYAGNDDAMPF